MTIRFFSDAACPTVVFKIDILWWVPLLKMNIRNVLFSLNFRLQVPWMQRVST